MYMKFASKPRACAKRLFTATTPISVHKLQRDKML
jgi:hypothetical protein